MSGVFGYVGATTSGKTTLAAEHLNGDIAGDGRPGLILDCMPARNLADLPHEKSTAAVYAKLYDDKYPSSAVYTPRSVEELSEIFGVIHEAGVGDPEQERPPLPVHVLWDEPVVTLEDGKIPMSVYQIDGRIAKALRGHQHNRCTFRLVSQSPKDFHGVFFMCMPEVYVFYLERDKDLERVEEMLRIPRAEVMAQARGQFKTYSRDRFEQKAVSNAEAPKP